MLLMSLLVFVVLAIVLATGIWLLARTRHADIWIGSYIRKVLRGRPQVSGPIDILVCITDHFEPAWQQATYERECRRVQAWVTHFPALASKHRDHDGVCPQYTFFFPEEQYRPEHLDALAELCRKGFGDVEIHLHHGHDTSAALAAKLDRFRRVLRERHGLLRTNCSGEVEYGFIHGNWALDNSGHHDGVCGVNDELSVLRRTGCYADFTLPAVAERAQTRTINSIYYAFDDPERPKSHDRGVAVTAGRPSSDGLMIVQGPLALNWKSRKFGVIPRIDGGELSGDYPPSGRRVELWVRQHIHVQGRPEWVFIKLHTHGAVERHAEVLLGKEMDEMLAHLEAAYNDGSKYRLHYVTARQMYNVIKAAEAGMSGDPHRYREFPANRSEGSDSSQESRGKQC
jgi:hypothetical protein